MKKQIEKKIRKLDAQMAVLDAEHRKESDALLLTYGITDDNHIIDCDFDEWTDSDWNYACDSEHQFADYNYNLQKLEAAKSVQIMLGHNIARRGKKLHAATAFKKLEKLGDTGKRIKHQIESSYNIDCIVNAVPYMHIELRKYGITLLDVNYYDMLNAKMIKLQIYSVMKTAIGSPERKRADNAIKKLTTQMQLFNQSVINEIISRKQQNDMAF